MIIIKNDIQHHHCPRFTVKYGLVQQSVQVLLAKFLTLCKQDLSKQTPLFQRVYLLILSASPSEEADETLRRKVTKCSSLQNIGYDSYWTRPCWSLSLITGQRREERSVCRPGTNGVRSPRNGKDWICNGRLMELKYLQTTFLRTLPVKKIVYWAGRVGTVGRFFLADRLLRNFDALSNCSIWRAATF